MGLAVKLVQFLAFLACVSLIIGGGTWVHDAHSERPHHHASANWVEGSHSHSHSHEHPNRLTETLIHCGSDNIWFAQAWTPTVSFAAAALSELEQASAALIYLQVEKPPPRFMVI